MPLKAIYERSPLVRFQQCPLSRGQVRSTDQAMIRNLYSLCKTQLGDPAMWEGAFSLACLLEEHPLEGRVAALIRAALSENLQDAFAGDFFVQLAKARAALALFEYTVEKDVLERLVHWCKWVEVEWEQIIADAELRATPADLMDFLCRLYRLTGVRAILRLCTRLRAGAFDWTTALQQFNQHQPLQKRMKLYELQSNMAKEEGDLSAYYTRLHLLNRAEKLADGMRFSLCAGIYSGNGQDLSAASNGWQQICKAHGALCGGTTADSLLAGLGSDKAVDAAAAAAWCEAFAVALTAGKSNWAVDPLMRLLHNAIPACIQSDGIQQYQRVNSLRDEQAKACFEPKTDETHALARLARAVACAWHTAVCAAPQGLNVNLLLDGSYTLTVEGKLLRLQITGGKLSLHMPEALHASLGIMIPAEWVRTDLQVNEHSAMEAVLGRMNLLERDWQNGDVIWVRMAPEIRQLALHHQAAAFLLGSRVLCVKASATDFAWAAEEAFMDGDAPKLKAKRVPAWHLRQGVPADVPVLPETEGESEMLELLPYAETPARIAVFAGCRKA